MFRAGGPSNPGSPSRPEGVELQPLQQIVIGQANPMEQRQALIEHQYLLPMGGDVSYDLVVADASGPGSELNFNSRDAAEFTREFTSLLRNTPYLHRLGIGAPGQATDAITASIFNFLSNPLEKKSAQELYRTLKQLTDTRAQYLQSNYHTAIAVRYKRTPYLPLDEAMLGREFSTIDTHQKLNSALAEINGHLIRASSRMQCTGRCCSFLRVLIYIATIALYWIIGLVGVPGVYEDLARSGNPLDGQVGRPFVAGFGILILLIVIIELLIRKCQNCRTSSQLVILRTQLTRLVRMSRQHAALYAFTSYLVKHHPEIFETDEKSPVKQITPPRSPTPPSRHASLKLAKLKRRTRDPVDFRDCGSYHEFPGPIVHEGRQHGGVSAPDEIARLIQRAITDPVIHTVYFTNETFAAPIKTFLDGYFAQCRVRGSFPHQITFYFARNCDIVKLNEIINMPLMCEGMANAPVLQIVDEPEADEGDVRVHAPVARSLDRYEMMIPALRRAKMQTLRGWGLPDLEG